MINSALQKEHNAISSLEIFRNFTYLEDDSKLTEDQLTVKNILKNIKPLKHYVVLPKKINSVLCPKQNLNI